MITLTPSSTTSGTRQHRNRWLVALVASVALLAGGLNALASQAASAAARTSWAGSTANPYGGTDYFVDASAGADANPGTSPEAAWKTLAKVNATTFQPGDRILLKGGETWNDEQLWPKGSGEPGKPISIDAYGDESGRKPYIATNGKVPTVIDQFDTKNRDTVGLTGAVNLRNQQYWEIANLELSNDDNFDSNITTQVVVRDGVSVSINADLFAAGADTIMNGITVRDLDIHHIDGPGNKWHKIYLAGINFQVFGSKQWPDYAPGGYYFEGVRIENNTLKTVELNAIQFGFNWFGDAQGQVDETGKFHDGWEQLWIRTQDQYSRNVYIGHNYAEDIGQGIFQFGNVKNLVAEYNEGNGWLRRYDNVSAGLYAWASADTVMRFNEVYDGPHQQYDATAWDLEFTNFNVTYEYNYSHDNLGGWMSYMGNSSNSIARYNLSVNDNGVLWKNMLSTNYSPTYVLNNVFVYDAGKFDYFHDEVLKDRVYFANNVFYNTSTSTPTKWFRKPGALDKGVFSNNVYFEAGGSQSPQRPSDSNALTVDPQFVGGPSAALTGLGVERIRDAVAPFKLKPTSPLIDAGRFNPRVGSADFFGTPLYFGGGVDVGLHEVRQGTQVTNPVDSNPIEQIGVETRTNLAKGAKATASSVHPSNRYPASLLTDGNLATRWAAADVAQAPVTVDLDLGKPVSFGEVTLSEFLDGETGARIRSFELSAWDATSSSWKPFVTDSGGIGSSRSVTGFGTVTTERVRLAITGFLSGAAASPTMTEIQLFAVAPKLTNPSVSPASAAFDKNASTDPSGLPEFTVTLGGDTLTGLRLVQPTGAIVGSLDPEEFERTDEGGSVRVRLTRAFAANKAVGSFGVQFEFGSGKTLRATVDVVDTTPAPTPTPSVSTPVTPTPTPTAVTAPTATSAPTPPAVQSTPAVGPVRSVQSNAQRGSLSGSGIALGGPLLAIALLLAVGAFLRLGQRSRALPETTTPASPE